MSGAAPRRTSLPGLGGGDDGRNYLAVDNGPILMAVTKKGRVRGDSLGTGWLSLRNGNC